MVLPPVYQGAVKGAPVLGYKKSGHFYSREDIDLLNTLASSGAVAIENARLVDQIKKEEIIRTNLSRYLFPQVVEDILRKEVEVNLGGDRKTVTILFMDLIGFTSLSERLQPEEVVSILNEYFTEMSTGIFKWQGTLDKFAGERSWRSGARRSLSRTMRNWRCSARWRVQRSSTKCRRNGKGKTNRSSTAGSASTPERCSWAISAWRG